MPAVSSGVVPLVTSVGAQDRQSWRCRSAPDVVSGVSDTTEGKERETRRRVSTEMPANYCGAGKDKSPAATNGGEGDAKRGGGDTERKRAEPSIGSGGGLQRAEPEAVAN
jgi:hypothetical protein